MSLSHLISDELLNETWGIFLNQKIYCSRNDSLSRWMYFTAFEWKQNGLIMFWVFGVGSSPSPRLLIQLYLLLLSRALVCIVNVPLHPLILLEGGGLCSLWEIKGVCQDYRAVILTDEEQLAVQISFCLLFYSVTRLSGELWKWRALPLPKSKAEHFNKSIVAISWSLCIRVSFKKKNFHAFLCTVFFVSSSLSSPLILHYLLYLPLCFSIPFCPQQLLPGHNSISFDLCWECTALLECIWHIPNSLHVVWVWHIFPTCSALFTSSASKPH